MSGEDEQDPFETPDAKTPGGPDGKLRTAVITVVAGATALDNAQNVVQAAHQVAHVISRYLGF